MSFSSRTCGRPEKGCGAEPTSSTPGPFSMTWGTGMSLGHKAFSPSDPTCTRFHWHFTGSESINPTHEATPGSSSSLLPEEVGAAAIPQSRGFWRSQGLGEVQRQGACLTFMPSTSMRRWTWNSAPTWMTLGTQYSSMLLNWEGGRGWVGAQHRLLRAGGFPGIWGPSLPRAELVLGKNPTQNMTASAPALSHPAKVKHLPGLPCPGSSRFPTVSCAGCPALSGVKPSQL